jgi:hypothetical protein
MPTTQRMPGIACPHCAYRPAPFDRWICEADCHTVWNTFWTRGLCPTCCKLWNTTQCPACGTISPHQRWYRTPAQQTPAAATEKLKL